MINRVEGYSQLRPYQSVKKSSVSFKDLLNTKLTNHAVRRIENRNISVTNEDASRINEAFKIAQSKGSNKTLILLRDKAAIVSVKDKKLITMIGRSSLKDNIFTNIDSVVLMDE